VNSAGDTVKAGGARLKLKDWFIGQHVDVTRLRRGRLFRKYFALILAFVCGALIVSGGIGLYFSYQENQRALAVLQREKAVAAAARVEQFLFQIEQQLKYAALPQLGIEGLEQRRIEFLKLLRQADAVTDVAQIDARGREQISESRLKMSEIGTQRDWSQEAAFKSVRPGQTWFGPVYFRKETEPYMSLAVRANPNGPVTVADVNLKFIWDVVSRIKVGQKGKAYVVDGSGLLVADPDIGLVLRKTDLSNLEQVKAALDPANDEIIARQAHDLAGTRVLSAHAPIELREDRDGRKREPLGWKVFVEQPLTEVYAGLEATVLRTVGLIVAGLLFSVLAAMWLAGTMVRPIRTLQDGAQRIGEGDLDTQIEVRTGDELQGLAEQFNRMTAQLRESYAGLERKVEERTNELKDTLEQQTAISEVLRVISSSPGDVQPVLEAVTDRAMRICESYDARIYLVDGKVLRYVAGRGPVGIGEVRPIDRGLVMGRAVIDRAPVHVEDLTAAEAEFPLALHRQHGHRTALAVPLLRENLALGVILLRRMEARPFTDKQIALLKTFADQAAIAIENARLFNETKESLEQQTAIGEVLRKISDTPSDVTPVLDAVASRATQLCDAAAATIYVLEGQTLRRTAFHGPESLLGGETVPYTAGTLTGRTITEGKPIHVEDIEQEQKNYPLSWEFAQKFGRHTMLSVPLLREGRPFGTMFLRRNEVRPFSDKQIALSKTFADQAAIAIENVRLFNETKEALEQQQASGEILGAISSSIADAEPVFRKILESCQRLFAGKQVGINLVDADGKIRIGAYYGPGREELERIAPFPPGEGSGSGAAIALGRVMHYPDVQNGEDVPETTRRGCKAIGVRSAIFAPMLWEQRGIGVIFVGRDYIGPFSGKEIALLKTFADQAVIAIQNARLFREIQEKSAQLEVANKHKSDFLANMSHELRTPLNAIIGFSEVLSERMFGELNEKQADYMKDIHESGKHLLSLINDILDLSKIEAGRMDLEVSSFHLPTAISNAMILVRERAQRHGIALDLKVDKRLADFNADERKFKQILLNLLSNAVKFTPDGGRVDVSAKLNGKAVEIAVRDTGIGIAPDDQEKVFAEFVQVGRDYTRKAEGTGLGLALTKRFVELHGGELRLESTPGKGSTFTFTLPIRQ
jgi:signal transduction histidine kinase